MTPTQSPFPKGQASPNTDHVSGLVKNDKNSKLAGAKEALKAKLLKAVMAQAIEELGTPDDIAALVETQLLEATNEIRSAAQQQLRSTLIESVAKQTITSLAESSSVAKEALQYVTPDHLHFQQAQVDLRARLVSSIAKAAVMGLDGAQTVKDAEALVDTNHDHIQHATEAVQSNLVLWVAQEATARMADVDAIAMDAQHHIDLDSGEMARAIESLRASLLRNIADRATSMLENSAQAASDARSQVKNDHEYIIAASGVLRELMLEDIARRTTEGMLDYGTTARQARSRIAKDNKALLGAMDKLRQVLVQDIADRTTEALSDAEMTAANARAIMGELPHEVDVASAQLNDVLIDEIATRSTDTLKDAAQIATLALERINIESAEIEEAQQIVHERMLNAIMNDAIDEINVAVGDEAPSSVSFFEDAPPIPRQNPQSKTLLFGESTVEASNTKNIESRTNEYPAPPKLGFSFSKTEAIEPPKAPLSPPESFVTEPPIANKPATLDPPLPFGNDLEKGEDDGQSWMSLSKISDNSASAVPMNESVKEGLSQDTEDEAWNFTSFEPMQFDEDAQGGDGSEAVVTPFSQPPAFIPSVQAIQLRSYYYVYGIMATAAIAAFQRQQIDGIDPEHEIEFLSLEGLTAIVSKVDGEMFGAEALNVNLKDSRWVREHVRAHAQILEHFRASTTLVPLRFGTVYDSPSEVTIDLENRYGTYINLLSKLAGKQEWGLRIYRDSTVLLAHLSASDQKVNDSLLSISKGVARFVQEEMNGLGTNEDEQNAELLTAHCVKKSHDVLSQQAENAVFKALVPGNNDGKGEMIANVAYLVDDKEQNSLKAALAKLKDQYENLGFIFEMTGPWPPYHFVGAEDSST